MKRLLGYTLVELLVVVVILVILSTVFGLTLTTLQAQTRDSERKADVLSLEVALGKYFDNNGTYPVYPACQSSEGGCAVTMLSSSLVPTYLAEIPAAPTGLPYTYMHTNSTTTSLKYGIYVTREADQNCKTGELSSTWWTTTVHCGY